MKAYGSWALQIETPVVALSLAAPLILLTRTTAERLAVRADIVLMCVGVVVLTTASYLTYLVFDAWFWLRFFLPAWPALLVLSTIGLLWVCRRIAGRGGAWVAAAVIAYIVVHHVQFLRAHGTFTMYEGELKTTATTRYIAERLPERAVFLAMQQSGSVRYYAGRLTLRYDLIEPKELEQVVNDLKRLQYHPYVVLEEWEEPLFKKRFAGVSRLGRLDWTPVASSEHSMRMLIYDLMPDEANMALRTPDLIY